MPAIKELHAAVQALSQAADAQLGTVKNGLQQLEHRVDQGDKAVTGRLGQQLENNQKLARETQHRNGPLKVREAQQPPLVNRVQGIEDVLLECRTLKMNFESRIPQIEAQLQKVTADIHAASAAGIFPKAEQYGQMPNAASADGSALKAEQY